MRGNGNCYSSAGSIVLEAEPRVRGMRGEVGKLEAAGWTAYLVHAEVFHPRTRWHGHAWVEVDPPRGMRDSVPLAFDRSNGNDVRRPAGAYRYFGRARNVRRYTTREVSELVLVAGSWGPWTDAERREASRAARARAKA